MKVAIGLAALLVCAVSAVVANASPASGVTPTLVGRGSYDEFSLKYRNDDFKFEAEAEPTQEGKEAIDLVVRTHDYAARSYTGWHTHPGPVFITVLEGTLTVYEYDDPSCTPRVLNKGEGYVDTGRGHLVRNETDEVAKDVTVIVAPVGKPFRGEISPRGSPCPYVPAQ
jgi:quercetin dioxygenase-like cupin family protein